MQPDSSRHQIAVFIREGRRAAQQLSAIAEAAKSASSKDTSLGTTMTTMSTVLEQDFTVEGKKGALACPFSAAKTNAESAPGPDAADDTREPAPHGFSDPICAAMLEESTSQAGQAGKGAAKCPIRFMDQHSPEELAQYVEKHKHEIPRSHEVCVRRYQKSQEQIRKLDAKYGTLASMIKDLIQMHKPMLPLAELAEVE